MSDRATRLAGLSAVIAAAAAATVLGTAAASTSAERKLLPQRFTLYTANVRGNDAPVVVQAAGPISGVGTVTQTATSTPGGREINYITLRFAPGTVRLVAPERSGWKIDRRSCTANAFGAGTFRITGGTGAYRGVRGNGSFANRGVAVGARSSNGACLAENAPPVVNYVIVSLSGKTALGS
jgi:hypothetical protein